jgi:hypothetical protein
LLYPYKNRCHKYDHYYLTPSKTRGRAYISWWYVLRATMIIQYCKYRAKENL